MGSIFDRSFTLREAEVVRQDGRVDKSKMGRLIWAVRELWKDRRRASGDTTINVTITNTTEGGVAIEFGEWRIHVWNPVVNGVEKSTMAFEHYEPVSGLGLTWVSYGNVELRPPTGT